jgi:hypothetical protein
MRRKDLSALRTVMRMTPFPTAALLLLASRLADAATGDAALVPEFVAGQTFGTVFSIMRSLKADGFDEYAGRNGGSADYAVIAVRPDAWRLRVNYRYDGRATGGDEVELRDGGRTTCTLKPNAKEDCQPTLDGSGLIYNPLIWGMPPAKIAVGTTWKVDITPAWELGGAHGSEQVTVISVDKSTNTIVLLRDGTSEGSFGEGEPTQRQLSRAGQTETVEVLPGKAHWRGYTTVSKGIICSDELLVTRESRVRTQSGALVAASERWIMLLNSAPYPTLS